MTNPAPNDRSPHEGSAATKRQQKIAKAVLCSLCGHDWFAHDFDHPCPAPDCPCRDCEGGVCRG